MLNLLKSWDPLFESIDNEERFQNLVQKIGASPVAVDDVLYVRTDKRLYAFRD